MYTELPHAACYSSGVQRKNLAAKPVKSPNAVCDKALSHSPESPLTDASKRCKISRDTGQGTGETQALYCSLPLSLSYPEPNNGHTLCSDISVCGGEMYSSGPVMFRGAEKFLRPSDIIAILGSYMSLLV